MDDICVRKCLAQWGQTFLVISLATNDATNFTFGLEMHKGMGFQEIQFFLKSFWIYTSLSDFSWNSVKFCEVENMRVNKANTISVIFAIKCIFLENCMEIHLLLQNLKISNHSRDIHVRSENGVNNKMIKQQAYKNRVWNSFIAILCSWVCYL